MEHTLTLNAHWETGDVGGLEFGLVRVRLADIPFVLEEGFTANSAELGVVDNTFHPIPEPSTALLLGLGVAGLATMRRRTT